MSKRVGRVHTANLTEHDRLYIQFAMGMKAEHFAKYIAITPERRDYLFALWVKKNYPSKAGVLK